MARRVEVTQRMDSVVVSLPETRSVARAMMEEADSVAKALGVELEIGVDQRLAGTEKVGEHKSSMLQDVESGRPLEVEALVGAVVELGRLTETPTPHISAVYALVSLLAQKLADTGGKLSLDTPPALPTTPNAVQPI